MSSQNNVGFAAGDLCIANNNSSRSNSSVSIKMRSGGTKRAL
jgi:hypothetical protein